MEKNLTATFRRVDDMELAADELRKQGVLDIKFDESVPIKIDYQAGTHIESMGGETADGQYAIQVTVEMSRYRQAEDTIARFGGLF